MFGGGFSSWLRMFCPVQSGSASASSAATSGAVPAAGCPLQDGEGGSSSSGVGSAGRLAGGSAIENRGARLKKALLGGKCPFNAQADTQSSHGYGSEVEVINPRNMMPEIGNKPLPSDMVAFSRNRDTSSIPKTGETSNWIYPSPQQFYNALRRGGKVDQTDMLEKGGMMEAVVFAHNVTNEETWRQILTWEQMHWQKCSSPTLLSFVGKSEELSAGGLVSRYLRKRGPPFDRHDWVVDRCGIQRVRYVIDYYDDADANDANGLDIALVTRPALESMSNLWDRFRRPFWVWQNPQLDEKRRA